MAAVISPLARDQQRGSTGSTAVEASRDAARRTAKTATAALAQDNANCSALAARLNMTSDYESSDSPAGSDHSDHAGSSDVTDSQQPQTAAGQALRRDSLKRVSSQCLFSR